MKSETSISVRIDMEVLKYIKSKARRGSINNRLRTLFGMSPGRKRGRPKNGDSNDN